MTEKSKKLPKKESGDTSPVRWFFHKFYLFFRLLQRNTATSSSRRRWRGCGGTWRTPTPGTSSPTPVQQTKKSSKPTQTWPRGSASPNCPQPCLSIPFYRLSPCCLKMYFILMLSGWHPYDFTCSKCIGQGQICLSLVKREGSSCCGVETIWSLIQDLAQLVLFAISIGNESTWLVSCSVLGVHHDLYSLEF